MVVTRQSRQTVRLGQNLFVAVTEIRGGRVRLAPREGLGRQTDVAVPTLSPVALDLDAVEVVPAAGRRAA